MRETALFAVVLPGPGHGSQSWEPPPDTSPTRNRNVSTPGSQIENP